VSESNHNPLPEQLRTIGERLQAALASAPNATAIEHIRITFLGRNGEITHVRRGIGALPPDQRPRAGKIINDAVVGFETLLHAAGKRVHTDALEAELKATIDVTFPGTPVRMGSIHPLRRTLRAAVSYFRRRGFAVVLGPEIDSTRNNFDALNIPPDHPARESFDSFYVRPDLLLRPHTSPSQIRTMQAYPSPIAIVAPGKCYRRDAVDARHLYMFHQIEGLLVAPNIHFGHLKGMLTGMCRAIFGSQVQTRFRPSFFPFTEPSAEVDTSCPACDAHGSAANGNGCRTCSGSGWIEIGGAGMVHPNVLQAVRYDPRQISGWAFGIGIERVAMKRYDIDDIRTFVENDPSVLEQFA
jgi:phenylalanyl-tRNA synthetase alpha chain